MTCLIMDAAIPVPVDPMGDPAIGGGPIGGYGRYIPKGDIGPGNGILGNIAKGDPIGKEEWIGDGPESEEDESEEDESSSESPSSLF